MSPVRFEYERVLGTLVSFLEAHPNRQFTTLQITQGTQMPQQVVSRVLKQAVEDEPVEGDVAHIFRRNEHGNGIYWYDPELSRNERYGPLRISKKSRRAKAAARAVAAQQPVAAHKPVPATPRATAVVTPELRLAEIIAERDGFILLRDEQDRLIRGVYLIEQR